MRDLRCIVLSVVFAVGVVGSACGAPDEAGRDLAALEQRLRVATDASERMTLEVLGEIVYEDFSAPVFHVALTSAAPQSRRILLTGGVHGDEPAGVETLVCLIEDLAQSPELFPDVVADIVPLVNPWGWVKNRRRNGDRLDINRDFASFKSQEGCIMRGLLDGLPYSLAIDCHEDDGAHGFYIYHIASGRQERCRAIIEQLRAGGYPIEQERRMVIFKTDDGLMDIPLWSLPLAKIARQLSMTNHARMVGHEPVYLLESPARLPLERRVAMQRVVIDALIAEP